jgi:glutamate-1-semialdehyde 2,1-aminomutase
MAVARAKTMLEQEIESHESRTPKSAKRFAEALGVFPGGDTRAVTFYDPYPITVAESRGIELIDLDDNRYRDFLLNYTTLIVGHCHPVVLAAAENAVGHGSAVAAPVPGQVELARMLVDRVRSVERVRFVNSGSEATMLAIRLARAFTGRDLVVKAVGGYHGTFPDLDSTIAPGALPAGVPESTPIHAVPFNDVEALRKTFRERGRECAAVILEPVLGSGVIRGDDEFLHEAQRLAREAGALFVLDEVISFRLGQGGYQALVGLTPDLTTFGKIIGGGFPVGAVGGREDVMELLTPGASPGVAHSGTFNGNRVTVAAGRATLALLDDEAYATLDRLGARLAEGLREAIAETGVAAQVAHVGSLVNVHFTTGDIRDGEALTRGDQAAARVFHLGLLNRGIFIAPRGMYVLATVTTEGDVDSAIDTARTVLVTVAGMD